MLALGFRINELSLFGLVLAIGIVVDDAIVVVENVERNIALGLSPVDAARTRHERSHRADRRHRAGALRGVHSDRVHQRVDRPILQTVRDHHRDLDGDFRVQFAHAFTRALRRFAQGPQRTQRLVCARVMEKSLGWFFRPFNRAFAWSGHQIRAGRWRRDPQERRRPCCFTGGWWF